MELIARYAMCIDSGDLDGYVANFLPDGMIEWAGGHAAGHEEIRRWLGGLMASGRIGGEPAQTRHFVGLPYITGDSQRRTGRSYVIIFSLPAGGSRSGSSFQTWERSHGRTMAAKQLRPKGVPSAIHSGSE